MLLWLTLKSGVIVAVHFNAIVVLKVQLVAALYCITGGFNYMFSKNLVLLVLVLLQPMLGFSADSGITVGVACIVVDTIAVVADATHAAVGVVVVVVVAAARVVLGRNS